MEVVYTRDVNIIMHSYLRTVGFGGPDCNTNVRYLLDKIIKEDESINNSVKHEGESVEILLRLLLSFCIAD